MSSSSRLGPPDADAASARPRNRRPNATSNPPAPLSLLGSTSTYGSSSFQTDTGGRGAANRTGGSWGGGNGGGAGLAGLFSPTASAWVPGWSSIQEFATTLLANDGSGGTSPGSRKTRKAQEAWGPAPPGEVSSSSAASTAASTRPRLQDVAAGPAATRDAELKARKTASVLESHPGVNGGLDVRGNFKRRTSDENLRGSAAEAGTGPTSSGSRNQEPVEDCLAYLHCVKTTDTYFGIVLKYRCREDAFRKANGLWSRDNIQIRKWVVLPVDSCEIKGRPCDDPSLFPQGRDLLAQTPQQSALDGGGVTGSGYFDLLGASGSSGKGAAAGAGSAIAKSTTSEDLAGEPPWTHVRWVRLDSCPDPVEIVRMSRNALGYFPPRRKKSIRSSVSTVSTPRASFDGPANSSLPDRTISDSPGRSGSRRPSFLSSSGSRAALGTSPLSSSPSRYVGGGDTTKTPAGADPRPEWMRRPGGVGSMSKSVRAPGPARDSLNKWTTKHLPGLNIESLPSMSVMGSETAHFGFGDETAAGIVESSAEDGRDAALVVSKDTGLDKAAAAIEMWMRGAFTKGSSTPGHAAAGSAPSSSFAERIGRRLGETLGDLIELEDGPGEEGTSGGTLNSIGGNGHADTSRVASASGWRGESDGSSRGRGTIAKGKKAD